MQPIGAIRSRLPFCGLVALAVPSVSHDAYGQQDTAFMPVGYTVLAPPVEPRGYPGEVEGTPLEPDSAGQASSRSGRFFTIVALPDTQFYSATYPQIFNAQTQWIVANQAALNIAYVAHLGDIVDDAAQIYQWRNADRALLTLDTLPTLPYGLCVGNHDQNPPTNPAGTAEFNAFFPYTRYQDRPWYGGHYGSDNDNHYVLFSALGMDFIAIHLEYDLSANPAVLGWAGRLLLTYSDRRAIVVSHHLIGTGNPGNWGLQGQATYAALKRYPNLFLMLCGHVWGEGQRRDVYNGNTIYTLLSDYQNRLNGGNGWLRVMRFEPVENTIHVQTYSPTLGSYETDADSDFQLTYDMADVPSLVETDFVEHALSGGESPTTPFSPAQASG